jgi:hypothetical protein
MADGIEREELRRLVRDVLHSALLQGAAPGGEQSGNLLDAMRQAILPAGSGTVSVTDDLNHFAQMIVHAAAHEDLKTAIMSGRLTFKLNSATGVEPRHRHSQNPVNKDGEFRVDHGMLNETRIAEIGKSHTRIILGADVVVTPLARDRARELKLELVRSKP